MGALVKVPEEVQNLLDLQHALPASDRAFALSLYEQFRKKGGLSDKQWHWVERLNAAMLGIPEPVIEVKLPSFGSVVALFKAVAAKLMHPKLVLKAGSLPVQLQLAGPKSSAPGTVTVTDGKPFGANTYYGRVAADGAFRPHPNVNAQQLRQISRLLCNFASDPAGAAAAYGHATGHCCFCGSELTSVKSVAVGYGPICAARWNLPWGKKK